MRHVSLPGGFLFEIDAPLLELSVASDAIGNQAIARSFEFGGEVGIGLEYAAGFHAIGE